MRKEINNSDGSVALIIDTEEKTVRNSSGKIVGFIDNDQIKDSSGNTIGSTNENNLILKGILGG